ncbi:DUF692 domain-containing protein [Methylocystis sp. MJC1]|jgi:hypothetical protein|uniref:MNIO family bufferin maturase n=1 Tax=Methylocystis sp. MJC1 TaxID=2654282 RepID=UPI0013ECE578|nr:DUF692 domain-containing protein [Methylocystis sp. MJC1]KAF2989863.1 hypothetical protein MJC1_02999 [Methylocystis sp. MJC1]MBU6528370.1 DUF692 domain-containing protein [Methylocystis sp. MJC1]UZX11274.1 DUF692 domain-containing protein [Methylocystis sp. MJC1]
MRSVETISSGCVGVGFKPEHAVDILAFSGCVSALEVHAENYMSAGGARLNQLESIRRDYRLLIHGVGLSIGGSEAIDREHLARVKRVVDRFEPAIFSEHLAWSAHAGRYFGDLFPLPYTPETLDRVTANIHQVQDALQRRILLENPATYVEFEGSCFTEIEFIAQIVERTDCGLLLDVSNVFVSACNHGFEPEEYIDAFPISSVEEVHLAGYAELTDLGGEPLLIDAHNSKVAGRVWALYERVLARRGPVQTVIEWDNDIPAWDTLLSEAVRAESLLLANAHGASVTPS